ncbi:hypothetical protein ABT024_36745 [Streptomyces sp. NPDC002812]
MTGPREVAVRLLEDMADRNPGPGGAWKVKYARSPPAVTTTTATATG